MMNLTKMKFRVAISVVVLGLFVLVKSVYCGKPSSIVNVGAIFTSNSIIGKVAKTAMEIAVSDVNRDPRILNGTELKLIMGDAECNAFVASVRGTNNHWTFHSLLYLLVLCNFDCFVPNFSGFLKS